MSETIIPPYAKWGTLALCHAIANLMEDVAEGKNTTHAKCMLIAANRELGDRLKVLLWSPEVKA